MKELIIEEKACRYDEVIEIANSLLSSNQLGNAWIYKLLPELRESEDERIRKNIIKAFKIFADKQAWVGHCLDDIDWDACIAWLEKQGEQKFEQKFFINDKVVHKATGKIWTIHHYLKDTNSYYVEDNDGLLHHYRESELKLVEQKPVIEIKSAEKSLGIDSDTYSKIVDDCIYSEQKPADKIQLGKKYKCIASPRYSAFMTGEIYKPEDKFLCSLMNFCSDCFEPIEDGEQKPVDKVEPKFKIGDTIVEKDLDECGYGTIKDIKDGQYIFTDDTGMNIDEQGGWQLKTHTNIKQKPTDSIPEDFEKYVEQLLSLSDGEGHGSPAKVKEVSLKLLKLAKIEQNPAWGEEDDAKLKSILFHIEDVENKDVIDWLKSLIYQKTWKPSDEQIEELKYLLDGINWEEEILVSLYNDLKKLREE